MDGGIVSRRATNKLNDRAIKSFISKAKAGKAEARKLSDGGGLFLTHTPAGTAVWRIKYRYPDPQRGIIERLYAIGIYPAVTLEKARAERDGIKATLDLGHDPVQARQLNRAAAAASSDQTFEAIALSWLEKQKPDWGDTHYTKSKRVLENDAFPAIGKLVAAKIEPYMVTAVIEKVLRRGVRETAAKLLQHITAIFQLAQARGVRNDNPAESVKSILPRKKDKGRMAALLSFTELGDLLRRAEIARLSPAVRMAHRLCAFTGARISNVAQAEWPEFDLEADVPTWTIPREKMKSKEKEHDHKIILGPQIAEELRQWRQNVGGKGYLFPSPAKRAGTKSKPYISRESLEKAYRVTLNLADKHSPHGWRSSLSTLAKDNEFDSDVVELALDHIHDKAVVRAYDRGERLEQRIKLMNWWNAQLVQAQRGADVVQIPRKVS